MKYVLVDILEREIFFFGDEPESRRRFKVKMPIFDDEPESRRRFKVKSACFWRRA